MTEAEKQLVLEVNHVSGGYRTPGLRCSLMWISISATERSWVLSARAEPVSLLWPE